MFKFKTKKDRKIEELEKEINRLNAMLVPKKIYISKVKYNNLVS